MEAYLFGYWSNAIVKFYSSLPKYDFVEEQFIDIALKLIAKCYDIDSRCSLIP